MAKGLADIRPTERKLSDSNFYNQRITAPAKKFARRITASVLACGLMIAPSVASANANTKAKTDQTDVSSNHSTLKKQEKVETEHKIKVNVSAFGGAYGFKREPNELVAGLEAEIEIPVTKRLELLLVGAAAIANKHPIFEGWATLIKINLSPVKIVTGAHRDIFLGQEFGVLAGVDIFGIRAAVDIGERQFYSLGYNLHAGYFSINPSGVLEIDEKGGIDPGAQLKLSWHINDKYELYVRGIGFFREEKPESIKGILGVERHF
ncbi:MAG: hypothetical protein AABX38_00560 [Candidatus Micrarchaeota archaeon]